MVRVCIICEGLTEREFVSHCLTPHLQHHGVVVETSVLNGNVSAERVASFVQKLFASYDYLTTFVDFYGFKHRIGKNKADVEQKINEAVGRLFKTVNPVNKFFPYVQMYEFEGLLFSNVEAFEWVIDDWNADVHERLLNIRQQFVPENINDGYDTKPSKRISKYLPSYDKVEHGLIVADSIGLSVIRSECPLFDSWVSRLESLK